ncbi:MAG: hypothetical protein ACR2JY_08595 [Chloroflexota bacterium]
MSSDCWYPLTMSLVALQPGCQTCKEFGFGVGTAAEAEAVVLAVVVLVVVALAVVAVAVLAAADAALVVDVVAAVVVTALAAEVVAADVVAADVVGAAVAADAVVGTADDWLDVDTVAEAPQAARPTAARNGTLAVSAARRDTYRWDHREESILTLQSSGYDDITGDVRHRHGKGDTISAALYPVCCDLSTDSRALIGSLFPYHRHGHQAARTHLAPGS